MAAFVVGDKTSVIGASEPTVDLVIKCLLSTYYLTDFNYPPSLMPILGLISNVCIGTAYVLPVKAAQFEIIVQHQMKK